jgi:hypothetical protein
MAKLVKAQIRAFLHDYKKRVFEIEHDQGLVAQRKERVQRFVTEVLSEKSHYHFHQKIDKAQADTLDLIYDFCHEAMLPPIVTKLAERISVLEARQHAVLEMAQKVLDVLSAEEEAPV